MNYPEPLASLSRAEAVNSEFGDPKLSPAAEAKTFNNQVTASVTIALATEARPPTSVSRHPNHRSQTTHTEVRQTTPADAHFTHF